MMLSSCSSSVKDLNISKINESISIVEVNKPSKYILLPIQEDAQESKVKLMTGSKADTEMDVRIANNRIDYYVPFALTANNTNKVEIKNPSLNSILFDSIKVSDSFDAQNRERFRPLYHHTPLYGWMNDANGLVYKDGEYHLYFQYNPYGSMWGNMHWGHSVSKDLVNWEHLPAAIERDTLGHIFSGSSVVDFNNSANYGDNTIVSFYTSASDKNGQIQCMAYSKDNGNTFTKYEKNPILTSELKDFRDPKVFWYAPQNKWIMIVSADKEMRFYQSKDLKQWDYMSAFGKGYGALPSQFECPDMVELPVDGNPDKKKWALIVNINPGGLFGGSATQYFVGDFDGEKFICNTEPNEVKWLDWGKDHYATVTFSNTSDRVIAVPWMSNWQYCQIVPTKQFRSANALPRELTMYSQDNNVFLAANPVAETLKLRKETKSFNNIDLSKDYVIESMLDDNQGAYEIEMSITSLRPDYDLTLQLTNSLGEYVDITLDSENNKIIMDRSKSGIVDFGADSKPHEIENHDNRKTNSINYINDFALGTWAPLANNEKSHKLRIFVDRCSVEIFLDNGKVVMTNLVFPNEWYNTLKLINKKGKVNVDELNIYKLSL
ncbi:MAG: GH32 C-terminal domain-containing protein [Bacteroidales bacterium]|nr:GH32 C-terminal domain-containing protein [Bacteroidales bacterium]